jgi:FdrA protein
MQVSRELQGRDGVRSALVAMATELNLDLLAGMGFEPPIKASPNDMLVAIDADSTAAVDETVAALEAALVRRPSSGDGSGTGSVSPPATIGAAARRSEAGLALVSTPGRVAALDAADAICAGLDVMVFSDNVSIAQEVALKDLAAAAGVLMMGPDCGTAVVGGVGLGFANVVRPGPVGIVAASGTGAQHLMTLLDGAGIGVKHCLGVGGRDLSAAVAGRSTKQAMAMLDGDPATELVLVVSKPPDDAVATDVAAYARTLTKPVILGLLGQGQDDITTLAHRAVDALGLDWTEPFSWDGMPLPRGGSALRGLFAGGTLCDEAMVIASAALGAIPSNIPLRPEWAVGPDLRDEGHLMLDFGDDALTRGRPHPMIDQRSRVERIAVEGDDPTCRVLLIDVVLGHGAHPDPASELAPAIAAARDQARQAGRDLAVVVSLCACHDDPQVRRTQAERLREAGAAIYLSNAAAARRAVELVTGADQ